MTAPAWPTSRCSNGAIYRSSHERRIALHAWIDFSNHTRPHPGLNGKTPAQRLAERNNLTGAYT